MLAFLEKFGFTNEELQTLKNGSSNVLITKLCENKKLVQANLRYLVDLGAMNVKEIFLQYVELFFMDNSNFVEIFNKYDREDLIEKINKNVGIVEFL